MPSKLPLDDRLRPRLAVFGLIVSMLLALLIGTRSAGPAAARSILDGLDGQDAWILLDGFEDPAWPDPNLWQIEDDAAPTWWPSSCQRVSGSRALWAFGGRVGGIEQPCGAGAPQGSRSTIYQRLDLRGAESASRLDLYFDMWLKMPAGEESGLFIFLHVPQADGPVLRVPIFGATGTGGRWAFPRRKLDLLNLTDITGPAEVYDLRGGLWRLEWVGLAPQGTEPGAGVYLDDLMLVWEPDPGITPPTPRPTSRPVTATTRPSETATRAPSATSEPASATPSATSTRGPTSTPIAFGQSYLPYLVSFWPPPPTATPTFTPDATATLLAMTPSATPTDGPSPTPTLGPSPTRTPTITVTPSVTPAISTPGRPIQPTATVTVP